MFPRSEGLRTLDQEQIELFEVRKGVHQLLRLLKTAAPLTFKGVKG